MDPVIQVRGLVNRFGKTLVHSGLDIDLLRGEVLGVVGASGSGKSVLLRSIVRLQPPTAGQITVLGADILKDDLTRTRARWGVMFQDGALFSALTVRENVEAPMRVQFTLPAALRRTLADLKLAMVGLKPQAGDLYPSQLSGGMRKRAGLARALALDPEILLLDEPTAGLDPIAASEFDDLIRVLRHALTLSVFLVTHDLDTFNATCDRIAVLAKGKVQVSGTLTQMQAVTDPWVQSYFHGPRAHAVWKG